MKTFTRITVDPNQMGGLPCIRGLRIPVATVVGMVGDGMAEAEILRAHPNLEVEVFVKHCATRLTPSASESFRSLVLLRFLVDNALSPLIAEAFRLYLS